jgi:hypothetical protein
MICYSYYHINKMFMDTNYDPWCYIEHRRSYRLLINLLRHHIDLDLNNYVSRSSLKPTQT